MLFTAVERGLHDSFSAEREASLVNAPYTVFGSNILAVFESDFCRPSVRPVLFIKPGDENSNSKWSALAATILTISFIVAIQVIPAQVFRRGSRWRRIHRQCDQLCDRVPAA